MQQIALGRLAVLAVSTMLVLTACGGQKIEESGDGDGSGSNAEECGTVDIAVNPWVGYEANAAVIALVAERELGCEVELKDLKEEVAWQGFTTGEVDAIVENWGHPDLKEKYIDQLGDAKVAGTTGNKGIIGWYVPPWMADKYPDVTNWENLNKYADLFRTSESGDKGQLLDGDPSFVTNDAALVENLDLDFKVHYAGSEQALIQEFRRAERNKTPLLGYFYEPQWFLEEVPLVHVELPPYESGCDADPEKVACDYPAYDLDKIVSTEFAESGSPAYELVENFQWTNEDQQLVAGYIAQDKMSTEAAAKKWLADNPDTWKAWLP